MADCCPVFTRQVKHDIIHRLFDHAPKAAGADLPLNGQIRNFLDCLLVKGKLHLVQGKQFLILFDNRVLRFCQDPDHRASVQLVKRNDNRHSADKFRDQAELDEILRLNLLQNIADVPLLLCPDIRLESHASGIHPALNDLVQSFERASADKQDVGRVNLDQLLLRVLSPALRRNRCHSSLQDLQQRLLDPFAGHIPGD